MSGKPTKITLDVLDRLRSSSKMKKIEDIGEEMEKIVNHYYLSKKLEVKSTNEKKLKI